MAEIIIKGVVDEFFEKKLPQFSKEISFHLDIVRCPFALYYLYYEFVHILCLTIDFSEFLKTFIIPVVQKKQKVSPLSF